MSGNIKVICRFRPQNKREIAEGGVPVIEVDDNGETVTLNGSEFNGNFTFDKVFPMDTTQENLFDYSVRDTVDDVINGYNGTVFAYGQTGSGKTFTMMGSDIDNPEMRGVIPRITERIFASILEAPSHLEFTVKVSYMEIYLEKIRDLLAPQNDNLPVHEEKARGVYVKGLLEVYVANIEEVYKVMKQGQGARVVAHTNMNAESSRSHSIFVMNINQKNVTTGANRSGKLYLVDLAGSEKVGKTGASGQTLEEAKKINKSLTALGMVINALTDGKSTHVPYRDSKLTRILQESLGGNSRTTLIINASPSSFNEAETLSTLRFGMRAKSIKNKAKINQELSAAELKALLRKSEQQTITFKDYIGALDGEVAQWRQGESVPPEKQVPPFAQFASARGVAGIDAPAPAAPSSRPSSASATSPSSAAAAAVAPPRTGTPALAEDEREEFLRRENELTDDLAKKESDLEKERQFTKALGEELEVLKKRETELFDENKELTTNLHDLKVQLEKITFQSAEDNITMEDLKEKNGLIVSELERLREQLAELEKEKRTADDSDKEKRRQEKMAAMMAELDPTAGLAEREREVRASLENLMAETKAAGEAAGDADGTPDPERELKTTRMQLEHMNVQLHNLTSENELLTKKNADVESRLQTLQLEYQEMLEKTIEKEESGLDESAKEKGESLTDLREKLEASYVARRDVLMSELDAIKEELQKKNAEVAGLTSTKGELQQANELLAEQLTAAKRDAGSAMAKLANIDKPETEKDRDLDRIKKTMATQLTEFDNMKKSLMRDLQNRCEKVVELELSLDDIREQYNNMMRNNNIKATQKKMAFLERNLEQLTSVQRQLVEQNTTLKRDISIADRKLVTRNERIQTLEDMLQESQGKNAELKLAYEALLKETNEMRRQANDPSAAGAQPPNETWLWSRISKPIRGGGGNTAVVEDGADYEPEVRAPNGRRLDSANSNKRSSWLGGLMGN